MSDNLRLLDLFCGAGGAAQGYYLAGFSEIVGVDIAAQPRYPFTFVQGDALAYLKAHGHEFDVIHASPPCQGYTYLQHLNDTDHPRLIGEVREALQATGKPWVIENVEGARWEMRSPIMLCGVMFGLQVFRHRLFETNPFMLGPPHPSHDGHTCGTHRYPYEGDFYTITGKGGGKGTVDQWRGAMGIQWMIRDELAQAIPPAYTHYLGCLILSEIGETAKWSTLATT